MNYINEIKAFYDQLETNSLPSPAIVLWHALMLINNKTGWQPEFAVAVSVLEVKTGLNAKAIERARNALQQAGLINWRKRKGNQSAVYSINSLCDKFDNGFVAQNVVQSVPQPVSHTVAQPVSQSVAINKLNKTKQDNNPLPPKGSKTKSQKEEWEELLDQRNLSAPLKAKILEWLQYKRERKELYKPTGLKSFLTEMENKAQEYAEGDIISLINECMANNWRGIIWDKIKRQQAGREGKEKYQYL